MRISLFLLIIGLILGLFLWVTLSGALLWLGGALLLFLLVITIGYSDTAILFFLGAREVRSGDEESFIHAAAQEAYKLAVPMPNLYFYNGSIERGFILQNRDSISLVLSKSIIEVCRPAELSAICFELLLQVKKGMAAKRTKVLFLLGLQSWLAHSLFGIIMRLLPSREIRQSINLFLNYMLHPWLNFNFRLLLGEHYFKKLENLISDYPVERELLKKVSIKLRKAPYLNSVPSRKMVELSSSARNHHFQNMLALEVLPHEWDLLFSNEDLLSAEQA